MSIDVAVHVHEVTLAVVMGMGYPWVLLDVRFEYPLNMKFSHLWNAVGPNFFLTASSYTQY